MADERSAKSRPSPTYASSSSGLKLRGSCRECAVSKVKCHKEKPICSRCAKRNTSCEYFAAKRPGRARRPKDQETTNNDNADCIVVPPAALKIPADLGASDIASMVDNSLKDIVYLNPFGLSPESIGPDQGSGVGTFESSDFFSGLSTDFQESPFPDLGGIQSDFDEFLSSEFSEVNALAACDFSPETGGMAILPAYDQINCHPASKAPVLTPSPTISSNSRTQAMIDTEMSDAKDPTCCCLSKLLGALEKLLRDRSRSRRLSKNVDDLTTSTRNCLGGSTKTQLVVVDNQQVINSLRSVLQCPCEKDDYMLTLLAMIVTKLLSRYSEVVPGVLRNEGASKARSSLLASKPVLPQQPGHGSVGHGGVERLAAQKILSELHRVQRLINELCPQLLTQKEFAGAGDSRHCQVLRPLISQNGTLERPFSAVTLDGIGKDMRSGLSALSKGLIGMLQET
ncbi:hypothetical protein F4808DRAFT_465116 [Astrocystis sublimbata]|nr:hypothetical protein F4808DRAFT_465116 [Astrocystis sublimbata]